LLEATLAWESSQYEAISSFVMEMTEVTRLKLPHNFAGVVMVRRVTIGLSFLLLGLLVSSLALAQKGTIAGKVVDAKSGDGLPGANVLVQGLEFGAATNPDGEFTIAAVPPERTR
jgi:hypothetical protein